MRLSLLWLGGLVRRRAGRLAATASGVAVAVALLASLGTFVASSKATMTRRAVANVGVDWQVEAQPGADPEVVVSEVQGLPRVEAALPVGVAATTGFEATTEGTTQTTGPGVVLGLPDGYAITFPGELRPLLGSAQGAVLAQQTAANLHAGPAGTVAVGRAGLAPVAIGVDGVVDLPQADSLFQKVGAPAGSQPQAPPDNVLVVPLAQWHALFDPLVATRPDLVRTQVHVRLSHHLPADPARAFSAVSSAARNLEARLAGAGLVGDNLSATLDSARSDAVYAQVLFLFLGLPGAVLAALLTAAVAGAGATRRRRDMALLRTRGATRQTMARLVLVESLVVGIGGGMAGLGIAALVGQVAFGSARFGAGTAAAAGWAGAAGIFGLGTAAAAVVLPAWRDGRDLTVSGARHVVTRLGTPRWVRYGLDVWLLVASLLVFWLSSRTKYSLVLAPEGVPTVSVSYWALFGPALLWLGTGLLAWRMADNGLHRGGRAVRRLARPLAGGLAGTVAAALSRRRRAPVRAMVLVSLAVSFAISTAVFNATYRQQARIDARLTNGADVTVSESPGTEVAADEASRLARVPGVRHVEPLLHRFAYVGSDLQDLYAVRPETVVGATSLQDAYFSGGSARALMGRLAAQPDAVLVSAETVHDFQLQPGDQLRLRLQDGRTKQFREVAFRYAGVAKEFPTAPTDSFLVANARYVAERTGSPDVDSFLIESGRASPQVVAQRVRDVLGPGPTVTDVNTARRIVGSSLTAVDLSGLTKVELGFALALTVAASGLCWSWTWRSGGEPSPSPQLWAVGPGRWARWFGSKACWWAPAGWVPGLSGAGLSPPCWSR